MYAVVKIKNQQYRVSPDAKVQLPLLDNEVGESLTCCSCFKVTCAKHLQHVSSYNQESGLYQLMPICLDCAIRETIQ